MDDDSQGLRFRNYIPRSKALRQFCIPKPSIDELEKKLERDMLNSIDQSLKTVRYKTSLKIDTQMDLLKSLATADYRCFVVFPAVLFYHFLIYFCVSRMYFLW